MSLDGANSAESRSDDEHAPERLTALNEQRGFRVEPVWVWGVPLSPLSMSQAMKAIEKLADEGHPSYIISANVHYAMLCSDEADLRALNERAALVLVDGAPLVWASRWLGTPLPERVAGSDLIFELIDLAARKGYGVFFLGGADGVARSAVEKFCERWPALQVAGVESPPFRELSAVEEDALVNQIRAARPTILLTAFTMPRGERWLAAKCELMGVPVSMNVGAAFDFAAGRIQRAPRWMQRCGLEWAFRLGREPRRLFRRYARNALFVARSMSANLREAGGRTRSTRKSI